MSNNKIIYQPWASCGLHAITIVVIVAALLCSGVDGFFRGRSSSRGRPPFGSGMAPPPRYPGGAPSYGGQRIHSIHRTTYRKPAGSSYHPAGAGFMGHKSSSKLTPLLSGALAGVGASMLFNRLTSPSSYDGYYPGGGGYMGHSNFDTYRDHMIRGPYRDSRFGGQTCSNDVQYKLLVNMHNNETSMTGYECKPEDIEKAGSTNGTLLQATPGWQVQCVALGQFTCPIVGDQQDQLCCCGTKGRQYCCRCSSFDYYKRYSIPSGLSLLALILLCCCCGFGLLRLCKSRNESNDNTRTYFEQPTAQQAPPPAYEEVHETIYFDKDGAQPSYYRTDGGMPR